MYSDNNKQDVFDKLHKKALLITGEIDNFKDNKKYDMFKIKNIIKENLTEMKKDLLYDKSKYNDTTNWFFYKSNHINSIR